MPVISVIIPTRNRAKCLSLALESLVKQDLSSGEFEVLVVDNGSADETRETCTQYSQCFPQFQYLEAPLPGLHEGRHAGLKASSAPLLCFADDDIEAFPSWLSSVAEAFERGDVGLVGGKNLPKWESPPPHWLWEKWFTSFTQWGKSLGALSILDFGDKVQEIDPYYVFGCNFSIRKDLLLKARGFHPDGMPQDLVAFRGDGESYVSGFVKQSGFKTLYHPGASVYHQVPKDRMSVDYFQRRAFNQGVSDSYRMVRELGGVLESKESPRWRRFVEKFVSNNLLRRDVYQLSQDLHMSEVDRGVKNSYQAGFNFHQETCRREPRVLSWVLRESYLEH